LKNETVGGKFIIELGKRDKELSYPPSFSVQFGQLSFKAQEKIICSYDVYGYLS